MRNESIEKCNRKQDLKSCILLFSKADHKRVFAFTSGHLGALPLSDKRLHAAISSNNSLYFLIQQASLFFDFIKFIIFSLLPVKNIFRLLRASMRRFCNTKYKALNSFCVISLGEQPANEDAYFARLLNNQKENFDYLKIVGGVGLRSEKYTYVESALGYVSLIVLLVKIIFLPFTALIYSIWSSRKIKHIRVRLIYLNLCLKEINSGEIVNNLIIVRSIQCALSNSVTKRILFPMEGRNWEKLIVGSLINLDVESVGYIHCSLTPRHFSLTNVGFYNVSESPSLIVTPSEMIFEVILKVFPNTMVKKGFFLRGDRSHIENVRPVIHNCLLFALTANVEESIKIINYIKDLRISQLSKVVVRLNDNATSYKEISQYVEYSGLTLFSKKHHWHPSICFFRSSSVALDYLKFGVTPVYLHLDEIISNNAFDLMTELSFKTLEVDDSFFLNLNEIVKNNTQIKDGMEISRFFLDSTGSDSELMELFT